MSVNIDATDLGAIQHYQVNSFRSFKKTNKQGQNKVEKEQQDKLSKRQTDKDKGKGKHTKNAH